MDGVMFYDLLFLIVFCIWIVWFLITRKHNLKREGLMYLYRTQLGVKYIDRFSKKYSKILKALEYPIVIVGFILMISMIVLLVQTVYIYIRYPQITQIIKAPPVLPLIPYFPQIFGVQSFLPNFYFMYFLIALLIVAFVHEFSHGIYMRLFKMKIKSTGFGFLGPIIAFFVEQDEKDFEKGKRFDQMVVLGAGVFANVVYALIFFLLMVGFFNLAYSPSGYIFDGYAYNIVQVKQITGFTNASDSLTRVYTNDSSYIFVGNVSKFISSVQRGNASAVYLYFDSPAINKNVTGIITKLDGNAIRNRMDITDYLEKKKPGENLQITTLLNNQEKNYNIVLASNPSNSSKAFIGIASNFNPPRGIFGKFIQFFSSFKDNSIYYTSKINLELAQYIYNLLWWVMLINLFVALFNMLPLGILDGGRFFYLFVLGLTKKEKVAEKSFKVATKLILLVFLAMIIAWLISLF